MDKIQISHILRALKTLMFESIRLGSMEFEHKFKDLIEQMSTRE
jgi:hypothetical protein